MKNNEQVKAQLDLSQATGKLLDANTIELIGPETVIDKLYAIIDAVKSSSTIAAYESLGEYNPLVLSLKRASNTTLTFTGSLESFEDLFQKNHITISQAKPSPAKK